MARSSLSAPSLASTMAAMVTIVVLMSSFVVEAYVSSSLLRSGKIRYSPMVKVGRGVQTKSKTRDDGSAVTLYLFPTQPSGGRRQNRLRRTDSPIRPGASRRSKTSLPAMSDSVLAPCDTLPSFHTAHGLLSPEVVMRIAAENNDIEMGTPLHKFLKMYRSRGPMACLPLLSDPSVLPELTKAMRDIL